MYIIVGTYFVFYIFWAIAYIYSNIIIELIIILTSKFEIYISH